MMEAGLRQAERTLRPTEAEALDAWRRLVEAEAAQVEALPKRPRPTDYYAPIAETFRADPQRTDEPPLEHLRTLLRQDETWLDLGAGGGRYTLALALGVRRVYAVEPSEGMRSVLDSGMKEHGIENIDVFAERWPGPSQAPVADVGFISHVSYDIADIGPFLSQLEEHSRRACVALLFEEAPLSVFAPLWEPVHGERRILLPGLRDLIALLFARGRFPEVCGFDLPARGFPDLETLHQVARRPLWVLEGTPEDERLGRAVREMAVGVEGGVALSTRGRRAGVVSWAPRAV